MYMGIMERHTAAWFLRFPWTCSNVEEKTFVSPLGPAHRQINEV